MMLQHRKLIGIWVVAATIASQPTTVVAFTQHLNVCPLPKHRGPTWPPQICPQVGSSALFAKGGQKSTGDKSEKGEKDAKKKYVERNKTTGVSPWITQRVEKALGLADLSLTKKKGKDKESDSDKERKDN